MMARSHLPRHAASAARLAALLALLLLTVGLSACRP